MRLLLILLAFGVSFAGYHKDERGVSIHTPYRWVVADTTARQALSLAAADTGKLCLQMSDTTQWILIDNSPAVWVGMPSNRLLATKVDKVNASADTMTLTKGISATIGRFSGAIFGASATLTGALKADSAEVRATKYTGLVFASSGDSCMILKNGVPTLITAANLRIMSGAASTAQLADSCATKALRLHGITVGRLPYANASNTMATSNIRDTVDTIVVDGNIRISKVTSATVLTVENTGDNSPEMSLSGNRSATRNTLGDINFKWGSNIVARIRALSGSDATNKDDGSIAFFVSNSSSTLDTALIIRQTKHAEFKADLTVAGSFYPTSIFMPTGQGYYAYLDSIACVKRAYFPKGITTNNDDTLLYEDTTFYDSLYRDGVYISRALCKIIRSGSSVSLYQESVGGGSSGAGIHRIKGVPIKFRPMTNFNPVQTIKMSTGDGVITTTATVSHNSDSVWIDLLLLSGSNVSGPVLTTDMVIPWTK